MNTVKISETTQLPFSEETLSRMYDEWVQFQTGGDHVPDAEHCGAVVLMVQEFRQVIKNLKDQNNVEPLKKVV
jgi:hypothetical protein